MAIEGSSREYKRDGFTLLEPFSKKWIAVPQERVPYDDPIVLPAGEGLNIVRRRSDGQLTYRCDCASWLAGARGAGVAARRLDLD